MFIKRDRDVGLFFKMALIRACENLIQKDYHLDQMRTPMHMSMGHESAAVGILSRLDHMDVWANVYGSYRSHATYLVRTMDLSGFWDEMLGGPYGPNRGQAGSMHICFPGGGHWLSSGIVAGQIAPAVGHALALKQKGISDQVVTVFLGDGATNEGAFWESLNLASLYDAPIIFVVEDNGLAVHTGQRERQAYDLEKASRAFNVPVETIDGTEGPENFYECAYLSVWDNACPFLVRSVCHRELEHVGVKSDYDAGYRKEPLSPRDPFVRMKERMRSKYDDLFVTQITAAAEEGARKTYEERRARCSVIARQ